MTRSIARTVRLAALIAAVLPLASGCDQQLQAPDSGRPVAPAAGSDAGLSFVYCNTDKPENQTKFVAVMISGAADAGGDAGPCEIAYSISFGQVVFSCACGPVVDCQKIGAELAAQAAACLGADAGLEAGS